MFDAPKLSGATKIHKKAQDKNVFSIEVNKYTTISEE